ncbi:MAG: glycosyltransferase [Bacteroidetes bacterium]|nr:glycosyltransferase [Bacteroidota bacterium]
MDCKKISFCIVCGNRLHQLRETLPVSLRQNEGYPELEYVLLDYNSKDGMGDWVRENLSSYLESGLLTYYRTTEPEVFHYSHGKNVAFRLATGEILCNINADHFAGEGFAEYVDRAFQADEKVFLTPIAPRGYGARYYAPADVLGRICLRKTDFEAVQGFDERMNRYGFEDHDFANRLEMLGIKRILMEDPGFHQFVGHGDEERYDAGHDRLEGMYICYKDPSRSELLMMDRDGSFVKGTAVDYSTLDSETPSFGRNLRHIRFLFTVEFNDHRGWMKGRWRREGEEILFDAEGKGFRMVGEDGNLRDAGERGLVFRPVWNKMLIHNMLRFNVYFSSRCIMEDNLEMGRTSVNDGVYGRAVVYRNFDQLPIRVGDD